MKKLLLSVLSIIVLLTACDSGNNDKPAATKKITGTAATGDYIPEGSAVELRIAPIVNNTTILTTTIQGTEGKYTIDVTELATGPYLIRIKEPISGKWYYSYAENDATTANVNTYTDTLIRQWYLGKNSAENPCNVNIDDSFTNGIFTIQQSGIDFPAQWYGKQISLPSFSDIDKVKIAQAFSIFERYSVVLSNIFTQEWKKGESYDALLDNAGFEIFFIDRIAFEMFYNITFIEKADVYYNDSTNKIYAKVYSKNGDPSGINLRTNDGDFPMTYQTTDGNGVRYYTCEASFTTKQMVVSFDILDLSPNQAERIIGFPTYTK